MGFRVVVIGYSQMFASIIKGVIDSGNSVVGVLPHEHLQNNKFQAWIKKYLFPTKEYSFIKSLNLHEIDAHSVNSDKFRKELRKLNTDILLVASWGEKIEQSTIITPKIASINTHPSLLPKYRGPNPYLQVIKNQETQTGVTFHLIDENFDTGEILKQFKVPIFPNDTGKVLRTRCANTAQEGIGKLLKQLEENIIIPIPQDENNSTYYPQITLKDIIIDFSQPAETISAQLRAIIDWQCCYFQHKNSYFRVKSFQILNTPDNTHTPGTIIDKGNNFISVVTGDNRIIKLTNIKLYRKL